MSVAKRSTKRSPEAKRRTARSPEAKQQRRDEILAAAIDLYVRKGFFAGSMNDLARELVIAKGTLYVYFPSKESLWQAIMEKMAEDVDRLMQPVFNASVQPLEKLERLARITFEYYEQNTDLCDILVKIWAMSETDEASGTRSFLRQMYREYRALLVSIIREGVKNGSIRRVGDLETTAAFVLAALDGLMVQWLTEPDLFSIDRCMKAFRHVCIEGIAKEKASK